MAGAGSRTRPRGPLGKPLSCAARRSPAGPGHGFPSPAAVAKATAAEDSRAGLRPPANRTGARPSPDSLCSAAISGPGREAAPLRQKARAPEASGMVWDRVGGVRVRGRGGGAEAAERAPTRRAEGDEARLPALLDPARPFGARRRRRGSKPNSCRPGRPAGPGRGGWRPRAWEVGPGAGRRPSGRAGAAPIGPHRARTRGRRSLSRSSHTSISATS